MGHQYWMRERVSRSCGAFLRENVPHPRPLGGVTHGGGNPLDLTGQTPCAVWFTRLGRCLNKVSQCPPLIARGADGPRDRLTPVEVPRTGYHLREPHERAPPLLRVGDEAGNSFTSIGVTGGGYRSREGVQRFPELVGIGDASGDSLALVSVTSGGPCPCDEIQRLSSPYRVIDRSGDGFGLGGQAPGTVEMTHLRRRASQAGEGANPEKSGADRPTDRLRPVAVTGIDKHLHHVGQQLVAFAGVSQAVRGGLGLRYQVPGSIGVTDGNRRPCDTKQVERPVGGILDF